MGLFFITYDLRSKRDYKTLYKEFEKNGGVRVLESVWCIKVTNDYQTVRDHFGKFIDSDDGLLIIEASAWAATRLDNSPLNF